MRIRQDAQGSLLEPILGRHPLALSVADRGSKLSTVQLDLTSSSDMRVTVKNEKITDQRQARSEGQLSAREWKGAQTKATEPTPFKTILTCEGIRCCITFLIIAGRR